MADDGAGPNDATAPVFGAQLAENLRARRARLRLRAEPFGWSDSHGRARPKKACTSSSEAVRRAGGKAPSSTRP
ncbi:MAG: hypothetical protein RIT45_1903 [Pseudomonadota bacterium]